MGWPSASTLPPERRHASSNAHLASSIEANIVSFLTIADTIYTNIVRYCQAKWWGERTREPTTVEIEPSTDGLQNRCSLSDFSFAAPSILRPLPCEGNDQSTPDRLRVKELRYHQLSTLNCSLPPHIDMVKIDWPAGRRMLNFDEHFNAASAYDGWFFIFQISFRFARLAPSGFRHYSRLAYCAYCARTFRSAASLVRPPA
jgi:hypothetical protein